MLTAYQHTLIDALPNEGGFSYLQGIHQIDYPQAQAMELALLPLQGKNPAASKTAIILHGAPGSGKTYAGFNKLEETLGDDPRRAKDLAIISYDEHGAIFDIPEYLQRIAAFKPVPENYGLAIKDPEFDERMKAWADFRTLSQRIRSETFKHALRDGLSLYIDTTSSSAGTLKMIDLLRDLDYTHIEVWSYHSRLDPAAARIFSRTRPTSMDDLLQKRVGAMEMLPQLVRYADKVEVFENSSNQLEAAPILTFEAGHITESNPQVLGSTLSMMELDKSRFEAMAVEHFGKMEGMNLGMRYATAWHELETMSWPALDSFLARAQSRYSNEP